MSKTHWKKLTNPDYLGSYSLEPGQEMILTIKRVNKEEVTGSDGKKEEVIVVYFTENVKPMILNVTNCKAIEALYGSYIEDWTGRSVQVYSEKVKAFGQLVDALRIRKKSPEKEVLTMNHKQIVKIIQKIATGDATIETVREYYTVPDDIAKYIQSEAERVNHA